MKTFVASYQYGSEHYGLALRCNSRETAEAHARRLGLRIDGELMFQLPSWTPEPIVSLIAWLCGSFHRYIDGDGRKD